MRITMKIIKISTLIPLSISLAALAFASSSWAAGTASNTDINNTATLSYSVGSGGGTAQTVIESSESGNSTPGVGGGSATTFKVDKKIDLLVTTGSGVNVVPGTSAQAITFTLTNEGNSTEDFSFSVPTQVAGNAFDTINCATPANVTLAADAEAIITVECDIPASGGAVLNAATSTVDLKATVVGAATAAAASAGNADVASSVETVLADNTGTVTDGADRNASHSAVNTYTVHTADLTVKKTSKVVSMTINTGTAAAPTTTTITAATGAKRIPGAIVEYTITVTNAAGAGAAPASATGIVLTDTVPSELSISSASIVVAGASSASIIPVGQLVTSAAFDLAAGETAILTIITTVN